MTASIKRAPIKKAAGGFKTTTATATHNATDFIAAYACQASATAYFHVNPCAGIDRQRYRAVGAVLQFFPVLENTIDIAGNLPDSEVFLRPEHFGFGRDGLVRKAGRMAISMFSTSRPPVALEKAASGFQSRIGAETMTTVNTITTPNAAPLGNTPAISNSIIARHQAIENALCLALYYIRQDEAPNNIHAATVKAVRAASMLKQACAELPTSGRA